MAAVRLFVGGLAFTTSTDGLRAAFARFGPVQSAAVMTDRETGRSRGFGFVEMASEEEAEKAISGLNGSSLDGRMIRVDRATPRGAGGPRPAGAGGPRSDRPGGGGLCAPARPVRVTASDRAAAGAASLRGQAAAGPDGRAAAGRPRCPRDGAAQAGAAAVAAAIGGRASPSGGEQRGPGHKKPGGRKPTRTRRRKARRARAARLRRRLPLGTLGARAR